MFKRGYKVPDLPAGKPKAINQALGYIALFHCQIGVYKIGASVVRPTDNIPTFITRALPTRTHLVASPSTSPLNPSSPAKHQLEQKLILYSMMSRPRQR